MEALRNWKPTVPRVDVPEFTRCCFCLPLRHGLLAWGYIKLILLSFFAYQLISDLVRLGAAYSSLNILVCIVITDIVFDLVFVAAGHLKHRKLYQIYYYYSVTLLCVYVAVVIFFMCWNWYGYFHFSVTLIFRIMLEIISAFLPILFLQGYITLLVRTEVRKLANNSNFEFVNNAAEATCSMDLVNNGTATDLETNP